MPKGKIVFAILSVIMAVSMSACSLNILDNSDVMRPPRATGNEAEIQDCIEKQAGGSYTLKYPSSGEYRTAIIMHDLTGDGKNESVALYRGSDKASGINVSLLDEIDGTWQNMATFTNSCTEIDRVIFCDINGDGCDDVIIGWSNYGVLPSRLTAYVKANGEYRESSVEQTYSDIVSGGFTNNNCDSLILLTPGSSQRKAAAALVTLNDQKESLKIASTAEMNSNVFEFESISKGYLTKDIFGVAVDGKIDGSHCLTQVLYCDESNKLVNPFSDNSSMKRENNLNSCDINHDGIIEIPVCEKMPGENGEQESFICDLVSWKVFDEKTRNLNPALYTIQNEAGGYLLTINSDWYSKVTARNDDSGETRIYKWSSEELPQKGDLIYTVKRFYAEEWKKSGEDYTEILTDGGFTYAVKIEELIQSAEADDYDYLSDGTIVDNTIDYTVTVDEIKDGFMLIKDISETDNTE